MLNRRRSPARLAEYSTSASRAAPVTFALWMGTVVLKIISPAAMGRLLPMTALEI